MGKPIADYYLKAIIEEDELRIDINEDEITNELVEDRLRIDIDDVLLSEIKMHLLFTDYFDSDFVIV